MHFLYTYTFGIDRHLIDFFVTDSIYLNDFLNHHNEALLPPGLISWNF